MHRPRSSLHSRSRSNKGKRNPLITLSGDSVVVSEVCVIQDEVEENQFIRTWVTWEYAWNGYAEGWLIYLGPFEEGNQLVHYFSLVEQQ